MNCPRCKIEMERLLFVRQAIDMYGRLLPKLVYRCPKCLMDSSPKVHTNYKLVEPAGQIHDRIRIFESKDEQMIMNFK